MTTNDLSQCKNCIYHYTYNGKDMCKQVGDDFYLQWKVEDCPYHTTITSAIKISDEIYRLRAENAALRNEADTNAANAIQAKLHADELEVILFAVIRNSMVMPVGLRLGKSKREITEMTFATIEEIKKAIDYDAVKKLMEGKDE